MNDRARALILQLERNGSWMTAAVLASKLGCSARTIKSTVARLNELHEGTIISSSHGYRIGDADAIEEVLAGAETPAEAVPQTAQERRTRILCQLLMRHIEMDAEELAQELCISLTTLDNEIQQINAELAQSGVSLRTRAGHYYVAGDDHAVKRVISNLLFGETKDFFNQIEFVNDYFPDIDIKALRADIDERLKHGGYFINGYSLSNLILHIAIALERTLNGFDGGGAYTDDSTELPEDILELSRAIVDDIERQYQVSFSSYDQRAFALILSTCLVDVDSLSYTVSPDRELSQLVDTIRARVNAEYAVDLSDGEFGVRFALHLQNLLARTRRGVVLRNPQFGQIKNAYPYVYEIAVFIAEVIQSEMGVEVSEDEIAFIALHVGCFIEEQALRGSKLRALLVNPRFSGQDERLTERLEEYFSQDLVVDAVIDSPDDIKGVGQADIIIATQELRGRFNIPVVEVSPFLGEVDRALVQSRIHLIRNEARRSAMERNLYTFFRRDLFFIDTGFETEVDAIETMGDALIDGGFAFPDFKECLYAREAISTSAYGDIALPHPIDMDANKTAVAVSLHPDAIMWKGSPVHAVFMLSVTREDRSFFREVFEFVAHVLNERASVEAISRARTFDEFVETLLSYY